MMQPSDNYGKYQSIKEQKSYVMSQSYRRLLTALVLRDAGHDMGSGSNVTVCLPDDHKSQKSDINDIEKEEGDILPAYVQIRNFCLMLDKRSHENKIGHNPT